MSTSHPGADGFFQGALGAAMTDPDIVRGGSDGRGSPIHRLADSWLVGTSNLEPRTLNQSVISQPPSVLACQRLGKGEWLSGLP